MKIDSSKKMLFEMMHKVGGMPLNENNYPMGAEPEYAGDDAPYNQNDDDYEDNEPDPDMYRDDDIEEGWGKNLVAGGLATAATLGGMSGAQANQPTSNEPVKQGTENVDNTQQETFYNLMIGIAKYKDNPRSSIEAKKVYDEIINYFSALKEGKTPSELSQIAKNTVKKWYKMIKTTDNSTINTFIKLGEKTTTYFNDKSTDNVSGDNPAQKVAKNMGLGENEDIEEGWGKNLVAGGLATAATLGGMSGANAQTQQQSVGNNQQITQQTQADTTDLTPIYKGTLSVKKTSDGKLIIKTEGISADKMYARDLSRQIAEAEAKAQTKSQQYNIPVKPSGGDTFYQSEKYIVEGEWTVNLNDIKDINIKDWIDQTKGPNDANYMDYVK